MLQALKTFVEAMNIMKWCKEADNESFDTETNRGFLVLGPDQLNRYMANTDYHYYRIKL